MRTPILLTLIVLPLAAQAQVQTPSPAHAAPARALADRLQAIPRLRADDLLQVQGQLTLAEHPRKVYYQALAGYALAGQLRGQDPKRAEALMERALADVAPLRDADGMALHAGLLGLKIGFDPSLGMSLAPRALSLLGEARALAPRNPRVRFFEGIHLFHTPVFFGGGAEASLPALQAAADLAAAEPKGSDAWTPAWGHAEALAWLALAEADLGRQEPARAHLEEALALDPAYGFAHRVVAPKVQGGRGVQP